MVGLIVALVLLVYILRASYNKMAGKLKTPRCEAVDAVEIKPAIHVSSDVLSRSVVECLARHPFQEA